MPVFSRSGYGDWSTSLAKSFLKYPKFDIGIIRTAWGACANSSTTCPELENKIITTPEVPQPDIYISATIPHLSKIVGKKMNINISAGIETSFCYDNVIEALNKHQLNIVCSNFAKETYMNSPTKCTSPIEVLPWSMDTSIYKVGGSDPAVDEAMNSIEEEEAFLFVGQITHPALFLDRKDAGSLIKTFLETFRGKEKKPALVLKSSGISFSRMDKTEMLMKIAMIKQIVGSDNLPNIYLLHGELTPEQMNALFNHPKIIANISFSHGEGWCGPLIQGSLAGKPIIAPNHSGHLDFLPAERAILLDGKLEEIHPACISEYFPRGSKWFITDYKKASQIMLNFYYGDRTLPNSLAKLLATENANRFNLDKMDYRLHRILDKYIRL